MNNVFAAKLLQNLRNKKGNKGFTLIELLVVVIIVGVLAAVALPNLLSQVGKARETEIKNAVGTINRGQQGYHFERQAFADTQTKLGVSLTPVYIDDVNAAIDVGTAGVANFEPVNAQAATDGTRAYSGSVIFDAGNYEIQICQTDDVATTTAAPTTGGGCAGDAQILN
ncbi:MAG: type IV pilin-like G/H family protein [Xenococcaceae cyanobacterium]